MDHQKKLDFVLKMTKHGLDATQHFDLGGTALAGPVSAGAGNAVDPSRQGIAGAVGNVLGTNNNFQAGAANITPGTNVAQLNNAYEGAQGALGRVGTLNNLVAPGIGQGTSTQNLLTNQLTAQTMGQGPSPAQAQLNQATGRNIAQQAALAAGTRGAGANAGLVAANNAQQGANTQQQSIGQAAVLQAQQQLAAQQQLQQLAGSQVQQGTSAVQLDNQTQQNEQNILQGANTSANNAAVSMQQNINNTNAAVAAGNQNANQNVIQGIGNAVKSIGGGVASLFAKGGEILPTHLHAMAKIYHPHLAGGGEVYQMSTPVESPISVGSAPMLPAYTGDFGKSSEVPAPKTPPKTPLGQISATQGYGPDSQALAGGAGDAGGITGLVSDAGPALLLAAHGGVVGGKLKAGGKVPGKPKVDHDAYKNDTVSAKLSPGEVVIDLNTLKDKGKLGQMARFVAANIERKKAGRKL